MSKGAIQVRDYTLDTLNELYKISDDVNSQNPILDALGDGFSYLGCGIASFFGKGQPSEKKIREYQKSYIDRHDLTKKEIEGIFDQVANVDHDYSNKFKDIYDYVEKYNTKITTLSGYLQPKGKFGNLDELNKKLENYNSELNNISKSIDVTFNEEIDKKAARLEKEAKKKVFKSVVSIIGTTAKLVGDGITGNWVGVAIDAYNIVNDSFTLGNNIYALSNGADIKKSTDSTDRYASLQTMGKFAGKEGIAGCLEANGHEKIASVVKTVDTVVGVVEIVNDIKGMKNAASVKEQKIKHYGTPKNAPKKKLIELENPFKPGNFESAYEKVIGKDIYGNCAKYATKKKIYDYSQKVVVASNIIKPVTTVTIAIDDYKEKSDDGALVNSINSSVPEFIKINNDKLSNGKKVITKEVKKGVSGKKNIDGLVDAFGGKDKDTSSVNWVDYKKADK